MSFYSGQMRRNCKPFAPILGETSEWKSGDGSVRFLSETVRAHEFSHTVLHGRPKRGDLLVQAPPPPAIPERTDKEEAGAPERAGGGVAGGAGLPAQPNTSAVPPPKAIKVAALPSQGGRVEEPVKNP